MKIFFSPWFLRFSISSGLEISSWAKAFAGTGQQNNPDFRIFRYMVQAILQFSKELHGDSVETIRAVQCDRGVAALLFIENGFVVSHFSLP